MKIFFSEDELNEFLKENDLDGLDSQYSPSMQKLKKEFNAKDIHINNWWVRTPSSWICPVCNRAKRDIVKINKHGDLSGQLFSHHDHVEDLVKKEFERISSQKNTPIADKLAEKFVVRVSFGLSAYDSTIICSDCNDADKEAKKIANTHSSFSFSPKNIAKFIKVEKNKEHKIDKEKALFCWKEEELLFQKRLELINYIVDLGASNTHWYEISETTEKGVKYTSDRLLNAYGLKKLSYYPEELLFKKNIYDGNLSKWRYENTFKNDVPTLTEIQNMINLRGDKWELLSEDWTCPICKRNKVDTIFKSKTNKWTFNSEGKSFLDKSKKNWCDTITICYHCSNIATLLRKEVDTNNKLTHSQHWIMKKEELVRAIKEVRIHNTPLLENSYIDSLIPILKERIKNKEITGFEFYKG